MTTPVVLTRFAGPNWQADPDLQAFLPLVDQHFYSASEQHPMRRWEYAMALLARATWLGGRVLPPHLPPLFVLDVGGAGSPLANTLTGPSWKILVVDPTINCGIEALPSNVKASLVFSISVLEHVDDVDAFLVACVRPLVTGGLLFLTVDAWDPPVDAEHAPDTAHFHWMRKRIFSPKTVGHVMDALQPLGLRPLGGVDLEYKGNTLYDYTFASIALVKEG